MEKINKDYKQPTLEKKLRLTFRGVQTRWDLAPLD